MARKYKTLVMGASYGSLLGTKLAMAGHDTVLVCLPAEVEKINADGALVKIPVRGREGLVEINSRKLPGKVSARVLAWWAVAGLFVTLFAFLGVNMYLAGLHSYGSL